MIYNFSEIKKQNDWLEDELLQLKKRTQSVTDDGYTA